MKLLGQSVVAILALSNVVYATAVPRDRTSEFRDFVNKFFNGLGKIETKTVTVTATATRSPAQLGATACALPSASIIHDIVTQTLVLTIPAGNLGGNPVKGIQNEASTRSEATKSAATPIAASSSLQSSLSPAVTKVTTVVKHEVPFTTTVTFVEKGTAVTSLLVTTVTSTEVKTLAAVTTTLTGISSNIGTDASTSISSSTARVATPCPTDPITVTVTASSEQISESSTIDTTISTDSLIGTASAVSESTIATTAAGVKDTELASVTSTATESATATTDSAAPSLTEDPQISRTLDKRVIQDALASDGSPGPGEIPSLSSSNNFINFCMTQDVPLTNGQQVKTGSCNPTPMGRVLAQNRLPSATFQFPKNFDTIAANTKFTIAMKIQNLISGNFVNAQANYYAAPAQVDSTGTLIGHSHVVIQRMQSFDQRTPLNPLIFDFFKGLNAPAATGILTAEVTGGLPVGSYRIASINSAANHQPALSGLEQHGSLDAFAYFSVA